MHGFLEATARAQVFAERHSFYFAAVGKHGSRSDSFRDAIERREGSWFLDMRLS